MPFFKNHKQFPLSVLVLIALTFNQLLTNLSLAETTVTYFHADALGSVVAASDESGNLLWRKSYSPYGEKVSDGQGEPNAISYTGKKHDEVTGLTYFGARYYDPEVGRFMGMDPAGFSEGNPLSFNRFAYGNNNPYRYIDPDGLSPVDPHDGDEGTGSVHSSSRMQSALRGDSAHLTTLEGFAEGVTDTVMVADTISDIGNPIKGVAKLGIKKALKESIIQENPKNLIPTQSKSDLTGSRVKRMTKDMKQNGFNQNKPVDAWRNPNSGRLEIQNGHHRTEAAKKAGLDKIPVKVQE